jgi:hypothetical protein
MLGTNGFVTLLALSLSRGLQDAAYSTRRATNALNTADSWPRNMSYLVITAPDRLMAYTRTECSICILDVDYVPGGDSCKNVKKVWL